MPFPFFFLLLLNKPYKSARPSVSRNYTDFKVEKHELHNLEIWFVLDDKNYNNDNIKDKNATERFQTLSSYKICMGKQRH